MEKLVSKENVEKIHVELWHSSKAIIEKTMDLKLISMLKIWSIELF